ncbi:MAG TPA: PHP-associated domain-containing protein [Chloroflexota bacterium]|nr:PHP-associated domain-containing protein [Chloroflexota bacterium]
MKIDLHTHTLQSKDSLSRYRGIVDAVHRAGLDGIAVTDHDELRGAFELREIAPFFVIPAEEIKTSQGEIIGLFLSKRIEPGLEPLETIRRIRDQGGVVYVPHPFDEVRGSRITREALDQIRPEIDLLEVFNSRNALPHFNRRALEYASRHGLLAGAGSDAHTYGEYGHAYIDVPDFRTAEEFRTALRRGVWYGRLSSPLVHLRTRIDRTLKIIS